VVVVVVVVVASTLALAGAAPAPAFLRGLAEPRLLGSCAAAWGKCLSSRCCSSVGYSCYAKDTTYAQCQPTGSCVKGIHEGDPVETSWSCRDLTGMGPGDDGPGDGCSKSWYSCKESRCCGQNGYTCYEKDRHYAQCQPTGTCMPGVHEDDHIKTAWSCKVASTTAPPAVTTSEDLTTSQEVTTSEEVTTSSELETTQATTAAPTSEQPSCKDTQQSCEAWGEGGECEHNPDYMHLYCPKTCNTCGLAALLGVAEAPAPAPAPIAPLLHAAGFEENASAPLLQVSALWGSCSGTWKNCMQSSCCSDPGYTCYEKDDTYAQCLPSDSCVAGGWPKTDPNPTPWRCAVRSGGGAPPMQPQPPSNSGPGWPMPGWPTPGSTNPCLDVNQACPMWSQMGECQTNPQYMHQNCRKSCNLC